MEAAKAKTFFDGTTTVVTVDVLTGPNQNGLCKVAYGKKVLVRHVDRLKALNEQAQIILRKNDPGSSNGQDAGL